MADVYTYITDTGTITTDTGIILTEVQDEYKAVFGDDLNTDPQTPQGMLITAETLSRVAVADNNAALANEINPNLAGGVFLDAIMALTGIGRTAATPSSVYCTLTGVVGTVIPAGSRASETGSGDANLFELVSQVTIPTGGTISNVLFQSVEEGPIPANVGTLTTVVSSVLGWETITNPDDATLGVLTQSDEAARTYRRNTLFAQGASTAGAIIAALYQVSGVSSMTFRENVAATTQVVDGITMVAHSIYACVNGGTDDEVGTALVSKKSAGAAYNNGASSDPVTVEITEEFSGQVMEVLFDRPDVIEILVRATVSTATSVQDPTTAVVNAILDYQAGLLDGEDGLTVGTDVSAFELAGAINRTAPGIFVSNMEIKTVSGSFSNATIEIALWEIANIESSSITVVVV